MNEQISAEVRARIDALVLEASTPAEFLAVMRAAATVCKHTSAHIAREGGLPKSTAHWFSNPKNHGLPLKEEQVRGFFTACEFTGEQLSTIMSIWHTLDQRRSTKPTARAQHNTPNTAPVDSASPSTLAWTSDIDWALGKRWAPYPDERPQDDSWAGQDVWAREDAWTPDEEWNPDDAPGRNSPTRLARRRAQRQRRSLAVRRLTARVWPWLLATACLTTGVWVGAESTIVWWMVGAQAAIAVLLLALIVRECATLRLLRRRPSSGEQAAALLRDEDVERIVEQAIAERITEPLWGPPIGRMLAELLADNRQLALLDLLAERAHQWALGSQETIDQIVLRDLPRWAPKIVNVGLAERIYRELVEFTWQVRADPDHEMRLAANRFLEQFAADLQHDDTMIKKAERIKAQIMELKEARDMAAPSGHVHPAESGERVVAIARAKIGEPVLVPTGSRSDQCDLQSADAKFVQAVFAEAGRDVPRTAFQLSYTGAPVGLADIRPGDIVFCRRAWDEATEVAIYAGDDQMLCVPRAGGVVASIPLRREHLDKVRRVLRPPPHDALTTNLASGTANWSNAPLKSYTAPVALPNGPAETARTAQDLIATATPAAEIPPPRTSWRTSPWYLRLKSGPR